jgi:hypothetical protein
MAAATVPRNVASTGTLLSYVGGGYWGAWSGPVVSNAGTTTIFEFENPETISAKISWATDLSTLASGDLITILITHNDETVFRYRSKNEAARAIMDIDPIRLIIPGNQTIFKMTIYTQTGSDTISTFTLIGKEV